MSTFGSAIGSDIARKLALKKMLTPQQPLQLEPQAASAGPLVRRPGQPDMDSVMRQWNQPARGAFTPDALAGSPKPSFSAPNVQTAPQSQSIPVPQFVVPGQPAPVAQQPPTPAASATATAPAQPDRYDPLRAFESMSPGAQELYRKQRLGSMMNQYQLGLSSSTMAPGGMANPANRDRAASLGSMRDAIENERMATETGSRYPNVPSPTNTMGMAAFAYSQQHGREDLQQQGLKNVLQQRDQIQSKIQEALARGDTQTAQQLQDGPLADNVNAEHNFQNNFGPLTAEQITSRLDSMRRGKQMETARRSDAGELAQYGLASDLYRSHLGYEAGRAQHEASLSGLKAETAKNAALAAQYGAEGSPDVARKLVEKKLAETGVEAARAKMIERGYTGSPSQTVVPKEVEDAARSGYGLGDDYEQRWPSAVGAMHDLMSSINTGEISGGDITGGHNEKPMAQLHLLGPYITNMEKMAGPYPEVARKMAAQLRALMPPPNENGQYTVNRNKFFGGGAHRVAQATMQNYYDRLTGLIQTQAPQ